MKKKKKKERRKERKEKRGGMISFVRTKKEKESGRQQCQKAMQKKPRSNFNMMEPTYHPVMMQRIFTIHRLMDS